MTQVRGNLDIIVTEGERLTALINDVLDLAKMEAGRVEWRDEEVDVDAVVRQGRRHREPLFQEKDLPLRARPGTGPRRPSAATSTGSCRSSSTCSPTPASSPTGMR